MWIFSSCGFFSVVEKPEDLVSGMLTVRARVKGDLDALRAEYMPELGPIVTAGGSDYIFRARISREAFHQGTRRLVESIHYPSFKNVVFTKQGPNRARVYGKVWRDLIELEEDMSVRVTVGPGSRMAWSLTKTVQKFHQMHGHWPTRIEMPNGYYDVLLLDIGQLWHKPMLDKLAFSVNEDGIKALDDAGLVTDYERDDCQAIDHREAFVWMFG